MIISIIFIVLFAVELSFALLFAYLRGFLRTVVKLAGTILAGICAFGLTFAIAGLFSGIAALISNTLESLLGSVATTSVIAEALPQFALALLKPIIFAVLFFGLKFVFDLVIYFVLLRSPAKKYFKGQTAVTFVAGALIGIVCFWVIMVPVGGLTTCIKTAVPVSDSTASVVGKAIGLDSNVALKLSELLGGKKTFDALTKIEINGKESTLLQEVEPISKLAETITNSGELDLKELSKNIENSETGKAIVKENLDAAVEKWRNGEEANGIQLITGDEEHDELTEKLLDCIENSDATDTDEILNFLEDFKEIEENPTVEKMVEIIDEAGTSDAIKPFTDEMVKWYLHLVEEALEVDATEEIDSITLTGKSDADIYTLSENLAKASEEISDFESKLYTDEELTEEEYIILRNAFIKLEDDNIIGDAVSKLISEYDKK